MLIQANPAGIQEVCLHRMAHRKRTGLTLYLRRTSSGSVTLLSSGRHRRWSLMTCSARYAGHRRSFTPCILSYAVSCEQILGGFKQMMGDATWTQMIAGWPPALLQRLNEKYGV
jgi:hypothetical protein